MARELVYAYVNQTDAKPEGVEVRLIGELGRDLFPKSLSDSGMVN